MVKKLVDQRKKSQLKKENKKKVYLILHYCYLYITFKIQNALGNTKLYK